VEVVVIEVMQVNKVAKLFQTMAIVSLNMGNLNLEVSSLKNKLAMKEEESLIHGIGQGEGFLEGI